MADFTYLHVLKMFSWTSYQKSVLFTIKFYVLWKFGSNFEYVSYSLKGHVSGMSGGTMVKDYGSHLCILSGSNIAPNGDKTGSWGRTSSFYRYV